MVIMCRLVVLASLHLAGQIQRILTSNDNECVITGIQNDGHAMLPY